MKIRPLGNRILVKRMEEESTTKGGIIIPDTAKEKPQKGTVVAVGPCLRDDKGVRIPLEVREGNSVLFSKYAGSDMTIDGVEHIFMREDDILGILN